MNRRNFMKIVGGTLAGVMFVPKAKPQLTVAMLQKVKRELDAQKISDIEKDKLLAAIFGPPRCNPCYDDCPHQRQCYGVSRATMTEEEKAEYCVSKPFCKKCIFVKNCLLHDIDYKIFWDIAAK